MQSNAILLGLLALTTTSYTAVTGAASAKFSLGMNLDAFPFWNATEDHFKPNVNFSTTSNPWKDVVIDELKHFDCIRCMKLSAAGGGMDTGIITKWTDRNPKTNQSQHPRYGKGYKGTAYEWQILLATLANADLWTNIPPGAISAQDSGKLADFPLRLAILIKTGVDTFDVDLGPYFSRLSSMTPADFVQIGGKKTIEPLPEERKIYIEYGNERWIEGWDYSVAQATALNLTINQKWGPLVDGHLFDAWAQIQIWRAMHTVFGKDSNRVFRLCAGQVVSTWVTHAHLGVIDDPHWNPEGFELMGYAVAPYAPAGSSKNITEVSQLYPWLDTIKKNLEAQKAALEGRNTQLIAYEGGQQIFPDHLHLNSDPQMGPFYTAFWKTVAPFFNGIFNHFVYASSNWGLKRYPGQPDDTAAKWNATIAWYENLHADRIMGEKKV